MVSCVWTNVQRWLALAAALSLWGCPPAKQPHPGDSSPPERPAEAAGAVSGLVDPALGGWMGRMARRPAEFTRLTASSDGWNALWSAELEEAVRGFEESLEDEPGSLAHKVGAARAALELGSFYQAVFTSTVELTAQYVAERDRRRAKIGPITPVEMLYGGMAALLHAPPDPTAAKRHLSALCSSVAPEARPFLPAARAWLGLAEHLAGDTAAAQAAWTQATAATEPNSALLLAYVRARAGTPPPAELPGGDGSPYARGLRWSLLVRSGKRAEALRSLASLALRSPDHSLQILSPEEAGAAAGGATGDPTTEKTRLDFFGPYVLDELARLHLARAADLLAKTPGPGGCAAYWRGRALEALGDRAGAQGGYALVTGGGCEPKAAPGAAAGATPQPLGSEDPVACLVLTPFGTVDELARSARIRAAALGGKGLLTVAGGDPWVVRLDALRARAVATGKLDLDEALRFIPEDPRVLEAALEAHFEGKVPEQGLTALLRGRFFEHYVHGLALGKARIATAVGETRLAIKTYDALHDNTKPDELSTLNRPGYLLETALARWRNNDPQGTAVLLNVLWKRYPGVWPASEFVRRIRAVHALENIRSNAPISGQ